MVRCTTTFAMSIGIPTGHDASGQCHDTPCGVAPLPSTEHADRGFMIRDLQASDARACELFFKSLDSHDVRMRFASPKAFSVDLFLPGSGGTAAGVAFAAVDPMDAVLGVINLVCLSSDSAEVAIVIRSDRKRRGIGRSLLAHVIQRASRDGLTQLLGHVLAENRPMLALARRMGFRSLRWNSFSIVVSRPLSSMPVSTCAGAAQYQSP